jgi:peptidoglycan/xylan/chitin deacetylase (PgdA/CDA1 family)
MAGAFAPIRKRVIGAGLSVMRRSGLARAGAAFAGGSGAILMFHHVRPFSGEAFAPNRGLEIEPAFLDAMLGLLRQRGTDIVTLDEAKRRLLEKDKRRFAVLTFDDGYRDNLVHALPILERHEAPFTVYVATGFADRIAPLWWVDLETALRRLDGVSMLRTHFPARTAEEKSKSFREIYWSLREGPEEALRSAVRELADMAAVDSLQLVTDLCMDWDEIGRLAKHELCSIGAHTISHPMLAKHPADLVRHELAESRRLIEARLCRPAVHLAYPVGDPTSAGPREFAMARELGFETAVTTRKGMLFPAHAEHLTALPRLSVNGEWQNLDFMDALLTGMPFLVWNRGRRVITA